jgi:hypothetical protein
VFIWKLKEKFIYCIFFWDGINISIVCFFGMEYGRWHNLIKFFNTKNVTLKKKIKKKEKVKHLRDKKDMHAEQQKQYRSVMFCFNWNFENSIFLSVAPPYMDQQWKVLNLVKKWKIVIKWQAD